MIPNIKVFYPTRILSAASASDLMSWLQDNLQSGSKELLIDFRDVLFMDSTGLGILVASLTAIRQANGRLALCNLNGQARMLLEMSGMDTVFELYDTPADFAQSR